MPSMFQREDNKTIAKIYKANRAELHDHWQSSCSFKGKKPTKASEVMEYDYMANCYVADLLENEMCPLCGKAWETKS